MTLPHRAHSRAVAATSRIASASGTMSCSRRVTRCSTARRAERGPNPGSRAMSLASASILPSAAAGGARCGGSAGIGRTVGDG